ncbi:MAG TPA: hypothetical protein V6C72_17955, partial [Chroococcales cyanobacterium]
MQKHAALSLISFLSILAQTPGLAAESQSAADMARAITPIAPALGSNSGPAGRAAEEPAKSPESAGARDAGTTATTSQPATTDEATGTASGAKPTLKAGTAETILKGNVTHDTGNSPLLEGSLQAIPAHTDLYFVSNCNINSNVTQKGDEVWVTIGKDVMGGKNVVCPGGWQAHGVVTEAQRNGRHSRDGFLTIKFDKIVSPDKKTEVPFETTFSTKDSMLKSVAKVASVDAKCITVGAAGGAI